MSVRRHKIPDDFLDEESERQRKVEEDAKESDD